MQVLLYLHTRLLVHRQKFFLFVLEQSFKTQDLFEAAKETLMYRTVLWTLWERERVGRFGRMALKHVKYHV